MAANNKPFLLAIFLPLLLLANHATGVRRNSQTSLREARQCHIQQLSATRPSRRIQSEGGVTELWDELDDQFQCAGFAALRDMFQPNSLSLPHFTPSPLLVYIERGQGLIGITYPGCAETYNSRGQQEQGESEQEGEQRRQIRGDQHQKVHRVRRGDIVAIPAGAAQWCLNDGQEELVAIVVSDLNNQANELDQRLRSFHLAGSVPQESSQGQEQEQERNFQNVVSAFDENLLAEAFNVSVEVVRKMQKRQGERGYIVKVQGELGIIKPEEEQYQGRGNTNGFEEINYCNTKINQYLDNPREADVFSKQAGRLNTVNQQKLPVLRFLGMSAEKGNLYPNALYVPHWKINTHSLLYITQGEGQLQVVDDNGQRVFDDRVKEGDLIVVPQYYVAVKRAGNNGLEWVNFQTSPLPLENTLVGSGSTIKGMPLDVITNSYQMSLREARDLKYNREGLVKLVPPTTSSS